MFDRDGTNSRSQLYAQNADRTGPHDNKMVFAQRGATDGVGQLCHSQSECGAEAFPHKNNALIAVSDLHAEWRRSMSADLRPLRVLPHRFAIAGPIAFLVNGHIAGALAIV